MADSAQYVIDIAAKMTGLDTTENQLDALTASLTAGGKGADHFQAAVQQVNTKLAAASSAASAAGSDLARVRDEYKVLEDAATQAAKSAEKATSRGDVMAGALQARAQNAAAAVDAYSRTLRDAEAKAKATAGAQQQLATTLGNVRKLAAHSDRVLAQNSESLAKVQGGLSAVGGPLGRIGGGLIAPIKGFTELSQVMGATNATALVLGAGVAALVVGIVALAAAAVAGVAAVAKWAITLADSARSAELSRQAAEVLEPSLTALRPAITAVADETGIAEDRLVKVAKGLKAAKVAAADMPAVMRAMAQAEAALGEGGVDDFAKRFKAGKQSARDFVAEAEKKFGGIVSQKMLSLDEQAKRLKKNIGGVFGSLNIEPALGGLQTLVALFDKSTAVGSAMQLLFESVFQPIISQAQNAAYVVEAFVLGFLIGLTKLYIALKPAIAAVGEFFGFEDTSLTTALDAAKKAGEFLAPVIVAIGAALVVVTGLIAAAVGVAWAFNAAIMAIAASVPIAAAMLMSKFYGALDAVKAAVSGSISWWVDMGGNIVRGLANGITGAAGAVINAIVGVASGAIAAAKKTLGIASPSKEFYGIGDNTGQGFIDAVDDREADAQAAMADMVAPPQLSDFDALSGNLSGMKPPVVATSAEAPAAAGAPGKRSGAALSLDGATFNFYGVENAEQAEGRFGDLLTRLLEGDAASLAAEAV